MSHNHNPSYRAKEARQYIGVGHTLFYELVKRGKLPAGIKLSERCTVWRKSDLDKFLSDREKASRSASK